MRSDGGLNTLPPLPLPLEVFNRSPSSSLLGRGPTSPFRRVYGLAAGVEGVESGTDDEVIVPDEAEGTRRICLVGLDMPEPIDSDKSGIDPEELCREVSGRELSAADINAAVRYTPEFVDRRL